MVEVTRYPNELLAEYRGELYFVSTVDVPDGFVRLREIPTERYEHAKHADQEVPVNDLDAAYRDKTRATWRGQPFVIDKVEGDKALAGYDGRDAGWAKANGLDGNQYDWFQGWLAVSELEDVHVDRTDLLARWKREK
jgi:hypothetical protein